jgi:hypothetical protein
MVKRIPLAALAALTLAQLVPVPVRAQVGPDADVYIYGRPGPDRFEYDRRRRPLLPPPDDDYDRPRRRPPPPPPDDDWDRPRYDRRWRSGSICVTARGDCPTRPAPYNAPCGCEIPGFGYKRGQIGG